MKTWTLIIGIAFIALAVVIFVFADGLRRWYSGGFFAVMGAAILLGRTRWMGRSR
jgi:hypothetical protein